MFSAPAGCLNLLEGAGRLVGKIVSASLRKGAVAPALKKVVMHQLLLKLTLGSSRIKYLLFSHKCTILEEGDGANGIWASLWTPEWS